MSEYKNEYTFWQLIEEYVIEIPIIQRDYAQGREFEKVEDNMIIQKKGKYLMVLECQGINYDLMSEMEMASVEQGFIEFLNTPSTKSNIKAEYLIPSVVNDLINKNVAKVKVLDTPSKWFGVTYPQDRPAVVKKFQKLSDTGVYPQDMFK